MRVDQALRRAICFTFIFVLAFLFKGARAQTARDVFTSPDLQYYGIDFTQAKMIGIREESPEFIKDSLFDSWNRIILDEPKKFNLAKVFKKRTVHCNLTTVTRRNKAVNPDDITGNIEDKYRIPSARFDSIAEDYASGVNKTGIGFVFVVEYFSKTQKEGKIHLIFFDIASGKLLMRKTFYEAPSGFGLRSYWVNTIYHTIKYIREEGYKRWSKEEMKLQAK